ncbi:ankyrin repeat-containing domain protein [Colletotrichum cereale]|nr:ankyrin repeat-containing domain protein [Colletotrichum cereale]
MHEASTGGHIEMVKLFLRTPGIDVSSQDKLSRTPLFLASRYGHSTVVELLLDDGRNLAASTDWYGSTPLFAAVRNGHFKVVEMLLARGTSYIGTQMQDGFGRTLQWWARRTGNSEIAELLGKHVDRLDHPVHETTPIEGLSVDFNRLKFWCDACTLSVSWGSSRWGCDECGIRLCDECFELGIRCPDETHTMRREI